jgi:shikimate dehydrogenase
MMVAEMVMKPPVTAFLQQAKAHGCRIQLGEAVMLCQLDAQMEFFREPSRLARLMPDLRPSRGS